MPVSTDAILCYGFCIKTEEGEVVNWLRKESSENSDGDEDDENDQMDFGDFLAKLSGLEEPDDDYDSVRYNTDSKYKQAWSDYWAKMHKLEEEIGVTLVQHRSGDYPMYILAAEASVQTASRGYPIELGQSVTAQAEWREKLHAFCERANIQFEEPQFILCSNWMY